MGVQPQLYIEIKNSFIHVFDDIDMERILFPRSRALSEFSGSCKAKKAYFQSIPVHADGNLAQDEEDRTTVMMRDIPNSYSSSRLTELFDANGFLGRYDFLYLPIDFRTNMSLGYAFVNFVSSSDAQQFMECFDGFSNWCIQSPKVCQVSWADPNQGLEEHVERYRNSPVMHENVPDEFKPRLYAGGVRVAFPCPTKRIRPPRVRPAKRMSR